MAVDSRKLKLFGILLLECLLLAGIIYLHQVVNVRFAGRIIKKQDQDLTALRERRDELLAENTELSFLVAMIEKNVALFNEYVRRCTLNWHNEEDIVVGRGKPLFPTQEPDAAPNKGCARGP